MKLLVKQFNRKARANIGVRKLLNVMPQSPPGPRHARQGHLRESPPGLQCPHYEPQPQRSCRQGHSYFSVHVIDHAKTLLRSCEGMILTPRSPTSRCPPTLSPLTPSTNGEVLWRNALRLLAVKEETTVDKLAFWKLVAPKEEAVHGRTRTGCHHCTDSSLQSMGCAHPLYTDCGKCGEDVAQGGLKCHRAGR